MNRRRFMRVLGIGVVPAAACAAVVAKKPAEDEIEAVVDVRWDMATSQIQKKVKSTKGVVSEWQLVEGGQATADVY